MEFRSGAARVRVNAPLRAGLLAAVEARLARGEGFAIATLNLDHLVKLARDPAFAGAYRAQDFVTADGRPVVWLARLAGQRLELITGSDLIVPLLHVAAARQVRVGLLGATGATLAGAAERLREAIPGLDIAQQIAPPMGFDPDGDDARAALAAMQAAGVGLCLLALGAPKQERLAARGRELAPGIGFASIGAGLDFIAGSQRRAPAWVRAIALEWLWRMLSDPRRLLLRYLRAAMILPGQMRSALSQRRGTRP
ncbi:MAG: WecB/TagA/CpsF family glycosyltransferase [Rubellimicrobium sp.]|nr:WecB/TagA/CpsF family glycosyltransferase [Rubellimicrobium sp.]